MTKGTYVHTYIRTYVRISYTTRTSYGGIIRREEKRKNLQGERERERENETHMRRYMVAVVKFPALKLASPDNLGAS